MSKIKKFAQVRHAFLFHITDTQGREKTITSWARVRHPTREVNIVLTAEHVRKAIKMRGVGDTTKCSMAVCTNDHEDSFSHNTVGYNDWQYSRCFIASKLGKNGLPTEAYVYEHNDQIARLNDTAGGQQKLLERIERDGPITITLKPKRIRSKKGRPGKDRKAVGTRKNAMRGHKLRYATAKLSGAITDAA